MKKFTFISFVILSFIIGLAGAACSSGSNTSTTTGSNQPTSSNPSNTNSANTNAALNTDEDIPALVKAALPEAQSFTKQHKDIPASAIEEIEKETGAKISERDHHSYLAFATVGGKRTQIGAATIIKAGAKEIVIVYESKDGMPTIKEVRADGIPADFLKQFAGKGHDDKFQVGADLKASGVDDATAKAIAQAVRVDAITMQTLYGAAHSH